MDNLASSHRSVARSSPLSHIVHYPPRPPATFSSHTTGLETLEINDLHCFYVTLLSSESNMVRNLRQSEECVRVPSKRMNGDYIGHIISV